MAKNIFEIAAIRNGESRTIKDSSDFIIDLLLTLSYEVDGIFSSFVYVDNDKNVAHKIDSQNKEDSVELLSSLILESNKPDIEGFNKVNNPTIDFERDLGFRFLLQFSIENEMRFSLTGNISSKGHQGLSLQYFYSKHEYSFEWYKSVLECMVNLFDPTYAVISISLTTFYDLIRELKVKHPFGWITYFSNDYELQAPDDLKGIEYEYTDKGKYLILTREDFTISKEAYEVQRDRLLSLMKEVKQRVPEYSR